MKRKRPKWHVRCRACKNEYDTNDFPRDGCLCGSKRITIRRNNGPKRTLRDVKPSGGGGLFG